MQDAMLFFLTVLSVSEQTQNSPACLSGSAECLFSGLPASLVPLTLNPYVKKQEKKGKDSFFLLIP